MRFSWTLIVLFVAGLVCNPTSRADEPKKPDQKLLPEVHKNHVRKTSADYLSGFRRITWHYDFENAAELARETGRPMFVICCRAGTITDPASGKTKCAS